ncbi:MULTISPECIES: PilZ domain-containing protein [Gulbenkiania]|uniref:PilZ domain n=2 Tax=Gulbenkiania TaxID=397456 RepID=A0A0K6GUR5_9NEIS|nr:MULTISPECIES: PilZ domain-containing protein [Gulbenkiania]TCW33964.1 PilZ domain-containing protein [Gulbenkiania mobilis]CUA82333.1 PilZ domain [Gulbenkiania indica]
MSGFDPRSDRRVARRIRMGCKARIRSLNTGETHYGECTDLSVDGMALRTLFVPQFGERLHVLVLVPPVGGLPGRPLEARVEVRRCNEIERGRLYEIGVRIIERLG